MIFNKIENAYDELDVCHGYVIFAIAFFDHHITSVSNSFFKIHKINHLLRFHLGY